MAGKRRYMPSAIAGEVSPKLYGRMDAEFWESAAKKMQNFVPWGQGLAQTRPGTIYVGETAGQNEVLTDDFEDGVIDTDKWTELDPTGRITETGGAIKVTFAHIVSDHYLKAKNGLDTTTGDVYRMRSKIRLPYASTANFLHFGIEGMKCYGSHLDPATGSIAQYIYYNIGAGDVSTGFEVKIPVSSSAEHIPWYWFEFVISNSKRSLRIRSDDDPNCHEWLTLYEDAVGASGADLDAFVVSYAVDGIALPCYIDECTIVKIGTGKARCLPFIVSETTAYNLEITDGLIRFYKDDGGPTQITSGGNPVELSTPWAEADLDAVKHEQVGDIAYFTHPDHAPMKLIRGGDTDWSLTPLTLYPPPVAERADLNADYVNVTLTLDAVAGKSIGVTASAATFQIGDLGRIISSGLGRAVVIGVVSTTVAVINIIDPFSSVSIAASAWTMFGTPLAAIEAHETGIKSGYIRLSCATDEELWTAITEDTDRWTESPAQAGEYYLSNAAAGFTAVQPTNVYEEGAAMPEGTVGSLEIGEWDYGDNDALGYNTIYVRLSNAAVDPDKAYDANPTYLMRAEAQAAEPFRVGWDVGRYIVYATGMVKIVRVHSTTLVTAEVIEPLAATTATYLWLLQDNMWTPNLGYPGAIAFHENRLGMGGSASYLETLALSYSDDYENFIFGTASADGMKITMPGARVNAIKWLMSQGGNNRATLIAGSNGAEFAVFSSGAFLTPADRNSSKQTENGSADVQPINADGSILMVQRKGRTVRELGVDFRTEDYRSPERTFLAEHITASGVVTMAYQSEPNKTAWMVLGDGSLIGLTFFKEQGVAAWHKHSFAGGEVESIAVIPHPTTDKDQVWLSIKRTINSTTKRYIEVLNPFFDSDTLTDARCLDSSIEYTGGSTSTITGLGHLEGEDVSVVKEDGTYLGDYTVASGEIALGADGPVDGSVTPVIVGLKYTCTYQKLPIRSGKGAGKKKAIDKVYVYFYRTQGGKHGPSETAGDLHIVEWPDDTTLQTGWKELVPKGGSKDEWTPTIIQDKPLPMSILAMEPEGDF